MTLTDIRAALVTLRTIREHYQAVLQPHEVLEVVYEQSGKLASIRLFLERGVEAGWWLNEAILELSCQEQALIVAQNAAQEPPQDTKQIMQFMPLTEGQKG